MSAPARTNVRSLDLYDTDRADVGAEEENESRAPCRVPVAVPLGRERCVREFLTGRGSLNASARSSARRKHVGGEGPLKVERRAASESWARRVFETGSGEDAGAQEMLARMQTHVPVAALPIENPLDLGAPAARRPIHGYRLLRGFARIHPPTPILPSTRSIWPRLRKTITASARWPSGAN